MDMGRKNAQKTGATGNLTRQVMELTTITASARGRKLRVPAATVTTCEAGLDVPDEESAKVLHQLLRRTNSPALSAPRIKRPKLDSVVACADTRDYVPKLPCESVDLVLSDIPDGLGQDDWDVLHRNTHSAYLGSSPGQARAGKVFSKRRKLINGWSDSDKSISAEYYDWCRTWTADRLRVLKPGGTAFVFCGRRLALRGVGTDDDDGHAGTLGAAPSRRIWQK